MHMKNQGSGGTVQFLSRKWTLGSLLPFSSDCV